MRSCLLCLFLLASAAFGRPHLDTHHNASAHIYSGHHEPLIVHTTTGRVRGFLRTVGDKEIRVFYGIPFARPPLGELRFRRPQRVDPWPHILNADELPNSCYQERYEYFPGFEGEEMWNPNTNISEDCLYLNVWAPARRRHNRELAPLLVWVYGGGYMSGTATLAVYEASTLTAEEDVVVVAMQYRVGAFGFLYMPDGSEDSDSENSSGGNMGLYDQVLALQWLRENAAVFGADAETLTLFGESAGGGAVSAHLLSPVSKGLVRRGILQSGTINAPWSWMTAERAREIGRSLADDCGCNATSRLGREGGQTEVLNCLRNVDPKTISVQQWNTYGGILGFPSTITVDGEFITDDPMELLKQGALKETEIMIGSNRDEGTYFVLYDFIDQFDKDSASFLPRDKFVHLINTIFKDRPQIERDAILFQYTAWEHMNDGYLNQKMIGDMVGDYFFICPSNHFANTMAESGVPVYYYYFAQRSSTSLWGDWMGVMHGDEIDYVFGRPLDPARGFTDHEQRLSKSIMGYYRHFAATGRPTPDSEIWPPYSKNTPQFYTWSTESLGRVGVGPRATACAFWNTFMPQITEAHAKKEDCVKEIVPSASASSVPKLTALIRSVLLFVALALYGV
ncbi:acetylcholinesterase isoform X1 [Cloeon dipterum]|uniref:acetylcholinesterase isoform X1 n=1 Tax=Cloeon dipterum TaxID=197152 RepID=UPI00322068AD